MCASLIYSIRLPTLKKKKWRDKLYNIHIYILYYIYIYLLQLWYFYLNISASRERSVFSHIVRFILYATCTARVASKINENCIVTGWEKFQRSNKSLITLVVQYGNDILLTPHFHSPLARENILRARKIFSHIALWLVL